MTILIESYVYIFALTDPNLKNMAKQLIIQAAIEQDSNDNETEEEGLPGLFFN